MRAVVPLLHAAAAGLAGLRDGRHHVNRRQVVALHDPDDAGSVMFVTTTGTPELVRVESSGTEAMNIDFSDYDAPVTLDAPPAASVLGGTTIGI